MVAPATGAGGGDELPIDVDLIKVLASDTRRDILRLLGERRRTLTELADALGLKKATVLEHLKKLVEAGLIRRLDEERLWIYYELTPRGLRLVRPGRTRFYLIMAGAAVACVLVGAIVVVALSNGFAGTPLMGNEDGAARGTNEAMLDSSGPGAREVLWRGVDEDRALRLASPARANGTLRVLDAAGADALTLDVHEGVATLDGARIDALQPGLYTLQLSAGGVEAPLPHLLDVRDPSVAVFPRVAIANATTTLQLAVSPGASLAPPTPEVEVGGEALALSGSPPIYEASARFAAPGTQTLGVGRLLDVPILVLPDLALDAAAANGSLLVQARDGGSPAAGHEILLDDARAGETDAEGALALPLPEDGPHTLRVRAPDGRESARAYLLEQGVLREAPVALSLEGFLGAWSPTSTRVHVEVRNHGHVEQAVTLVARDPRGVLATGVAEVPAQRSAQLVLEIPAPQGPLELEAYAARGRAASDAWQVTGGGADAPQTAPTTAAGAPPQADRSEKPTELRFYAPQAPDARLLLATPTPYPTSSPEAQAAHDATPAVPGPGILLVAAAVLLAALAARRRR